MDSQDYKLIKKHYNDAAAVDMESAGIYAAALRTGHGQAIAVRGIWT